MNHICIICLTKETMQILFQQTPYELEKLSWELFSIQDSVTNKCKNKQKVGSSLVAVAKESHLKWYEWIKIMWKKVPLPTVLEQKRDRDFSYQAIYIVSLFAYTSSPGGHH